MILKGKTALLYVRANCARTKAVTFAMATIVEGGRISANEVDEDGVENPTLGLFLEAGGDDPSLVSVEIPTPQWEALIDEASRLVRTAADQLDWDGGLELKQCNWEEVLPEWMMAFQQDLVAMAHQPWLCQVDGDEEEVCEFNAMCPRHALAQAAAWVVQGDWPLPGSVTVEVTQVRGAAASTYARLVVVGPDPLPRLILGDRKGLVDWVYEHAPPCVSEGFVKWATSKIIDQAGFGLRFGEDWAYHLDGVNFVEMGVAYDHQTR